MLFCFFVKYISRYVHILKVQRRALAYQRNRSFAARLYRLFSALYGAFLCPPASAAHHHHSLLCNICFGMLFMLCFLIVQALKSIKMIQQIACVSTVVVFSLIYSFFFYFPFLLFPLFSPLFFFLVQYFSVRYLAYGFVFFSLSLSFFFCCFSLT